MPDARSTFLTVLLACSLGACVSAQPASAAELILSDLRLGWSYQPTNFDFTLRDKRILSSGDAKYSGDDDFANAWSLQWRGLRHWAGPGSSGGLVGGLGLSGTWYQYEDGGGDLQVLNADLLGGYAQAINDRWTVHALAHIGLGYATFQLDTPSAGKDVNLDGYTWDAGAEIGAAYRLARRWRLYGTGGWRHRQGALSGDGFELDLQTQGFIFAIGIGFIISPEPRRIE